MTQADSPRHSSISTKYTSAHDTNRIFGLDLLRSVAIVLVLLTHTISFLDPQNHYFKIPVYTGYFGVEFFFVLSGFLIGTILLKIQHQERQIDFKSIKIFWIRRWFRTLPNFYLMFAVYALLAYFAHHINVFAQLKYLAYLVFLQNSVTYQPNDFFQVAWSLSIEEWFYLTFPLLLFVFTKIFSKNRSFPFLITIITIIVVELCVRFYVALVYHHYWDEGFRKMMPLRLDSIAIGVLAAYIKFNKPAFWEANIKKLALLGACVLVGLTIYFSIDYVQYFNPITWDHTSNPGIFLETVFFTLLSFSIAALIPWLNTLKMREGIVKRSVTLISEISYSIYLNHLFVILALSRVFKHLAGVKYANVLLFAAIWIITIILSTLQYRYFEVKMTALRNHFGRKQDAIKIT